MSSTNEIDAMMAAALEGGDDPRITTYALGEMEPAERAAFEAELLAKPELKQEVDRVRAVARVIQGELQADATPVAGLPVEVKARVVGGPVAAPAKAGTVIRWRTYLPHMAAAGLLGIVGLGGLTMTAHHRAENWSPVAHLRVTIEGSDGNGGMTGKVDDISEGITAPTSTEAAPVTPAQPMTEKPPPPSTTCAPPVAGLGFRRELAEGQTTRLAAAASGDVDKDLAELEAQLREGERTRDVYLATATTTPPSTEAGEAALRGRYAKQDEARKAKEALSYAITDGKSTLDEAKRAELKQVVEEARRLEALGDITKAIELFDRAVVIAGGDPRQSADHGKLKDNPFKKASEENTGTFSIDVDTAGFATVRNAIERSQLPQPEAVRIEELLNYFPYAYAPPTDGKPFASNVEVTACPWQPKNRLVRIGIKGKELAKEARPVSNLVFLIDVSGSMQEPQKLPLLKQSLTALVDNLSEKDRVAIVVYAGASGLVLPSTTGDRKQEIIAALDQLQAGGGTNGGAGIELAYKVAVENFITGGTNRVVLCTDGDWNVGISDMNGVERLVVEKARSGVFLTCLGFFGSNYQDQMMERMADKGNGNYAGIDSLREAKKVLVEEMSGTLVTIAKDVKVQVEFDKAKVESYRLIGYENRVMANQDFSDDTKDAGEIGAGHCVTALYEVEPRAGGPAGGDLLTLRLRWKKPDGQTSELLETKVPDSDKPLGQASVDTRFAASVAAWGMLLRGSPYKGTASFGQVLELGSDALGKDPGGHRAAWLELVKKSKALAGK